MSTSATGRVPARARPWRARGAPVIGHATTDEGRAFSMPPRGRGRVAKRPGLALRLHLAAGEERPALLQHGPCPSSRGLGSPVSEDGGARRPLPTNPHLSISLPLSHANHSRMRHWRGKGRSRDSDLCSGRRIRRRRRCCIGSAPSLGGAAAFEAISLDVAEE